VQLKMTIHNSTSLYMKHGYNGYSDRNMDPPSPRGFSVKKYWHREMKTEHDQRMPITRMHSIVPVSKQGHREWAHRDDSISRHGHIYVFAYDSYTRTSSHQEECAFPLYAFGRATTGAA